MNNEFTEWVRDIESFSSLSEDKERLLEYLVSQYWITVFPIPNWNQNRIAPNSREQKKYFEQLKYLTNYRAKYINPKAKS